MNTTKDDIAANMAAALSPPSAGNSRALRVVAESNTMIWNAVVACNRRVYVAGPRWAGGFPSMARLDAQGQPAPYPDAAWNNWQKGDPTEESFVNVNALHFDGVGQIYAIDSGSPEFGGDPLPGAAKVVCIDLATDEVTKVYTFPPDVARPGSYVDDIRIHGDHGYLTDAGNPGIIILNMTTGKSRRVLDGHPSATAPSDRPIVVAGETVLAPDGSNLRVNSDPLEVSPDGRWFYFGPLEGPWVKIETKYLDDDGLSSEEIAKKVEPWTDLPPIGGAAMDRAGNLYFTDLADTSLKKRATDGSITTVVKDPDLHWVDAPFIDDHNAIWLPVPQLDRVALFHKGISEVQWPIRLYHLQLET